MPASIKKNNLVPCVINDFNITSLAALRQYYIVILTATVNFPKIGSGIRPAFFNIRSNEPPSYRKICREFETKQLLTLQSKFPDTWVLH